MKNLTLKQKQLVKEYARKLMGKRLNEVKFNPEDVGIGDYVDFGAYGNLYVVKKGQGFSNREKWWVTDDKSQRTNPNAEGWYIDPNAAENIIEVFEESKIIKSKKSINENNTYTMISALREIADDLLLQMELLIDNHYGKMEHKEFKDAWYKSSNEFEKKFRTIVKSLMKAGK